MPHEARSDLPEVKDTSLGPISLPKLGTAIAVLKSLNLMHLNVSWLHSVHCETPQKIPVQIFLPLQGRTPYN